MTTTYHLEFSSSVQQFPLGPMYFSSNIDNQKHVYVPIATYVTESEVFVIHVYQMVKLTTVSSCVLRCCYCEVAKCGHTSKSSVVCLLVYRFDSPVWLIANLNYQFHKTFARLVAVKTFSQFYFATVGGGS